MNHNLLKITYQLNLLLKASWLVASQNFHRILNSKFFQANPIVYKNTNGDTFLNKADAISLFHNMVDTNLFDTVIPGKSMKFLL